MFRPANIPATCKACDEWKEVSIAGYCEECDIELSDANKCKCGFDLWHEWHDDQPGQTCGECDERAAGLIP